MGLGDLNMVLVSTKVQSSQAWLCPLLIPVGKAWNTAQLGAHTDLCDLEQGMAPMAQPRHSAGERVLEAVTISSSSESPELPEGDAIMFVNLLTALGIPEK